MNVRAEGVGAQAPIFGAAKGFKRNHDKGFPKKNAAFERGISLNREASLHR